MQQQIVIPLNTKPAFSLLELIFAIVIMGLIASVGIPKLMNTKSDALVSTIKKDVVTITSAIQSYYLVNSDMENISDAITLNSTLWSIKSKELIFKDNDNDCIIIKIIEDDGLKLDITINSTVTTVCKKLNSKGIVSTSYDLY